MTDVEQMILKAIEGLQSDNKKEHKTITEAVGKINGRTRSLENWRAYTLGGLSIIGIIIAFIANKIF